MKFSLFIIDNINIYEIKKIFQKYLLECYNYMNFYTMNLNLQWTQIQIKLLNAKLILRYYIVKLEHLI